MQKYANRLKLDWALSTSSERKQFVDEYIAKLTFKPTEDELETIANYILFGKDEDGLNCTQRKEIQIETRNKTWQKDEAESLDALVESPTFNEATVRQPSQAARTKITRENFDREKTLKECPPHLRPVFEDLFARIDEIDLAINLWEFRHGKRKEPPRDSLRAKFTPDKYAAIEQKIEKWNQFYYLKQRHWLVELRREQFTLRDSYVERVLRHTMPEPEAPPTDVDFGADVLVMPLGLIDNPRAKSGFKSQERLAPNEFEKQELEQLMRFYWELRDSLAAKPKFWFDFRELEHVYELLGLENDLTDAADDRGAESTLKNFLDTLEYYKTMAELTDSQKEILELKINKVRNQDIADFVNKKYGRTYTANYISTIFRQKIIPKINEAAAMHEKIIENLCFEENFKRCSGCGKILLLDANNFVKRSRSKDGFASKCKKCDKADRQKKKEVK